MIILNSKICTQCKQEKPVWKFPRDNTISSEYRDWCTECRSNLITKNDSLIRSFEGRENLVNIKEKLTEKNDHVDSLIELGDTNYNIRLDEANKSDKEINKEVILLINSLKDKNDITKKNAEESLINLGPIIVIELLELLKNKENIHIRSAIVRILGKIGDETAVSSLLELLKDYDPDLRTYAADAITEMGPIVIDSLIESLKQETGRTKLLIIEILGNISNVKAVNPLIQCLTDKDVYIKINAIEALNKIGDKKAIFPFIDLLNDRNYGVRSKIAEILGNLGDNVAVQPLINCLNDQDQGVRINAIISLGNIGNKNALDPLIPFLKDNNKNIRLKVVEALGKIGGKKAINALIESLNDEDENVKLSSISYIGRLGDKTAINTLENYCNDKNHLIKTKAQVAIENIESRQNINSSSKEQYNPIEFLDNVFYPLYMKNNRKGVKTDEIIYYSKERHEYITKDSIKSNLIYLKQNKYLTESLNLEKDENIWNITPEVLKSFSKSNDETKTSSNQKLKYCPKCGETKPFSDFYKNKARTDGLTAYCKPCMLEYGRRRKKSAQQKTNENKDNNKDNPLKLLKKLRK